MTIQATNKINFNLPLFSDGFKIIELFISFFLVYTGVCFIFGLSTEPFQELIERGYSIKFLGLLSTILGISNFLNFFRKKPFSFNNKFFLYLKDSLHCFIFTFCLFMALVLLNSTIPIIPGIYFMLTSLVLFLIMRKTSS